VANYQACGAWWWVSAAAGDFIAVGAADTNLQDVEEHIIRSGEPRFGPFAETQARRTGKDAKYFHARSPYLFAVSPSVKNRQTRCETL